AERECRAEMPLGPREARRLHPAHLMLKGGDQSLVDDYMVDGAMAENDYLSKFPGFVAEHKVVGAVICRYAKTTHAPNRLAPESHCGPKRELHSLEGACRQHPGCHFHAHSDGLESRPQSALGRDAAIGA